MNYEYLILANCDEDNATDECTNCQYKGNLCNSQCVEVTEIYNSYIQQLIRRCKQWEAL